MIWNDGGFKEAYREKLRLEHTRSDAEVRAQAQAFRADAARVGGSSAESFLHCAGAAAAATLSGYVKGALDAFDSLIPGLEAELEEGDLNALRESLEQEIALRAKGLPASLRDFSRTGAHPALLRTILQEAPVKARQLLAERVAASRGRIHARIPPRALLDRATLIGHVADDADLADTLSRAILQAVGAEAPLYTSPELDGIRMARDGYERVLVQLRKNRMMVTIVTPRSIGDPWLWWATGVSAALGKPVFVLRAGGIAADSTLPVSRVQDIDLSRRDDIVRLLHAIQGELRRRQKDPSEIALDEVVTNSLPAISS